MNEADSCMGEIQLAEAFADHLRSRNSAAAERLAHRLAEAGEPRRAELLRDFARKGDHVVSADWWQPGARCHVSLGLPEAIGSDLWFDPLEVSCTIVLPWLREPNTPRALYAHGLEFHSWISLEPVAPWQLRGAHDVVADVPPTGDEITGEQADSYCKLFSKGLVGPFEWLWLKEAYGMDVVNRMWGDADEQLGAYGSISGVVELVTYDEIVQWHAFDDYEPRETSELVVAGLPFRTTASVQLGLWSDARALPRTWNS